MITQGLRVRASWRPNINCNILTPLLWPSRCVFLVLLMLKILLRTPIHQGSRGPLRPGVAFPTTSRLQLSASQLQLNWLLFNSSALYYLQTPTRRYGHASTPPQFLPISGDRDVSRRLSLERPVWLSSSGNNCHAVHRSLSSGASVYECIMGIFSARPISSVSFHPRDFLSQLPLECVTYFRCITLEWHFWSGQKLKMQQLEETCCHSNFRGETSANSGAKNSKRSK